MDYNSDTDVLLQQLRAKACRLKICVLLGWTEMQYFERQLENGIAYLYWYLPCDERARRKLERSRLYWNWFKNQWALHDESLLSFNRSLKEISVLDVLDLFDALHDPQALAVDTKPNSVVLNSIKNVHYEN